MAKTLLRSFAGGEITPEMFGRIDLAQFQTGLSEVKNFIVLPHGPVRTRKGSKFVTPAKISNRKCAFIPFSYNNEQAYVIEVGHQYLRFHANGGTVVSGGQPVELVTPYLESEVFDIHYVQSADVLTLVHPNHPPKELRRTSATSFTLVNINFTATILIPQGPSATPSGTGSTNYSYVVTAIAADTLEETLQSVTVTAQNNLATAGQFNTIQWTAVAGAVRYYVYKLKNGLFGFIGETDELSFIDDNITPDMTQTPPLVSNPFAAPGDYPSAVTYFEQRRCFAGTNNAPQNFWATRSATESNLNYSIPTRDDDAISLRLRAQKVSKIEHMVPLSDLLLLTSDGDFRMYTQNSDIFSPKTVSARAQSYHGANKVQPVATGESIVYVRNQSSRIHEVSYDAVAYAFTSTDISLMAPHLFDQYEITDISLTRTPFPIIWVVRSDGMLLGCTYMPNQKVWAWHHHPTDGEVEAVCGIPEGTRDTLYLSVKREIDGSTVRYIEQVDLDETTTIADSFQVDSGLSYSGAETQTITGLSHLEGKEVWVFGDGAPQPPQTVSGGQITLDAAVSNAVIGLPLESEITTLPLSMERAEAFGQGAVKNVNKVSIRIHNTGDVYAGQYQKPLTKFQDTLAGEFGSIPELHSREIEIRVSPSWNADGRVTIKNLNPTPMTILSLVVEFASGG